MHLFIVFALSALLVVVWLLQAHPRLRQAIADFLAERRDETPSRSQLEYQAEPSLLTPAERSFFGILLHATGPHYHVFAKVRLADLVHPACGLPQSARRIAFNKIAGKHVDFLLTDPDTLASRLVVELDDGSHKTVESGIRDSLKDAVLRSAGIPVLRVAARHGYSPAKLSDEIRRSLGTPGTRRLVAGPRRELAGTYGQPTPEPALAGWTRVTGARTRS